MRRRIEERQRRQAPDNAKGHQQPVVGSLQPAFPEGLTDTSLLVRYEGHVACHLWFGERQTKKELKVATHDSKLIGWILHMLPPVIENWLEGSGLSSLSRTSLSRIDQNLVSAFVER